MVKCEDCKKAEGIINFSYEPMLTMTHGWGGTMICRKCYVARIVAHITDCIKQAEEQKIMILLEEKDGK